MPKQQRAVKLQQAHAAVEMAGPVRPAKSWNQAAGVFEFLMRVTNRGQIRQSARGHWHYRPCRTSPPQCECGNPAEYVHGQYVICEACAWRLADEGGI